MTSQPHQTRMNDQPSPTTAPTEALPTIEARLTPWYIRRMLISLVLVGGFAAYFAYDWQIGYPKKKEVYDLYLSYKARESEEKAAGKAGSDGSTDAMREWARYSQDNKISIENKQEMAPMKVDDGKIREQMIGAILCAVAAAAIGFVFVRNLNTKLTATGDGIILSDGRTVPFAMIRKVDTRKWANKGLAHFWHGDTTSPKRDVIDGLKYGGFKGEKPYLPDQILGRVISRFEGELIELAEEETPSKAGSSDSSGA